jgi:hypothetical protein
MYQFNRTTEAEKYFDKSLYPWDFAVPRQGHYDYTLRVYKSEDCDRKLQWIFFKAKDRKVLKRLVGLDFVQLSKKNTSTPGFGKADVIELYKSIYS